MSREPFCKTAKKKRGRPVSKNSGVLLDPDFDWDVEDSKDYLDRLSHEWGIEGVSDPYQE